jgi:2-C-methyl-D-erythritol 4-phosphate cytidylyltransferase
VVIHDAARPLVTAEDIERCLDAMEGYDGATPALPVSDTVYQSEDGRVISSLLNRDWLYAGQTPECYDFEKYLKAHGPLNGPELARIRGGSEIAFMSGMSIALCEGNPMNFKVTDDAGMAVFQSIVSGGGV